MSKARHTREFWLQSTSVTTEILTWLAIHGNLCLALRHPANKGPSRKLVSEFVKALGEALVSWGAITREELANAQRIEREEGSPDLA